MANPNILASDARALLRTAEAPYLLRDNSHPDTVYLSDIDLQSKKCKFSVSTDRGRTWRHGAAPELAPYTDCGMGTVQPQNVRTELRQDSSGTLYYVHHAQDPTAAGARSIVLGRSTDGGSTWQTTAVDAAPAASSGANADAEVNFEPHMAIDPDQQKRVYVMWRRSHSSDKGPPTRPYMAVSEDGGASFGKPFMMFDRRTGFDAPRPIVAEGKLYAFYLTGSKVAVGMSTDRGKTWHETAISSAPDAGEPSAVYDSSRKTFSAAWHDSRSGDLDVYFSHSSDGIRWSSPVRLNDDPRGNRVGQYFPQLSLAPGGRIDAAWYDFRDDPNPAPTPDKPGAHLGLGGDLGQHQSVYYTYSTDGGNSWAGSNIRVSDVPNDRSKGTWNHQYFIVVPPTLTSGDDWALAGWSDTRNGDAQNPSQDIYTGLVSFGAAGATAAGADGHQLLIAVVASLAGIGIGAGLALLAVSLLGRRRRTGVPA